jgi:hypothetical protein
MEASEEDEGRQSMETGRVARYFLYRNRERQGVRKPQLKTVLDSFRERSRKRDPVREASHALTESLGLTLVCPDDRSKKFFLTRTRAYPEGFLIPFTPIQKAEYGLLTFVFFIVYFKSDEGLDTDQLRQNVEAHTGVDCDSLPFGRWTDVVARWASQDYLKLEKRDSADPLVLKRAVTLGPRFAAEFGERRLRRMARELIFDEAPPGEEEEEEAEAVKTDEAGDDEEAPPPPPPPPPPRRSGRRRDDSD